MCVICFIYIKFKKKKKKIYIYIYIYIIYIYTAKLVYNDTLGATKMCCYSQVVVVTRIFSTETIESVPAMCVVVKRLML